jgi:hypothetical protein
MPPILGLLHCEMRSDDRIHQGLPRLQKRGTPNWHNGLKCLATGKGS